MSQDNAQEEVERLTASNGLTAIPPFDDPDVVAGQGTIGIEIIEDMPDLSAVLIPLSGGGLAGGIAVAVKALKPQARVIGISMERGAAVHASVAMRPTDLCQGRRNPGGFAWRRDWSGEPRDLRAVPRTAR